MSEKWARAIHASIPGFLGGNAMRQRLRALRANESGFTLTELLIVIVILGVLTGVVVFAVGAFTDRGDEAACKSDLKAVEVAVEAYYAQNNKYPDKGTEPLNYTELVSAKYLREAPTGAKYDINLADATGVVTANPAGCNI